MKPFRIILVYFLNPGYIGPYSLGPSLQTMIHKTIPTNDKPLGWETQINSEIILNYSVQAQKALVNSGWNCKSRNTFQV